MSNFIILSAALCENAHEYTYRVCTDRIDWMADRHEKTDKRYTVVSVNGTELHVEEPVHVILDYIKDPEMPLVALDQIDYHPSHAEYIDKYGEEEGKRRYFETMHYPARHFVPKK